MDSRLGWQGLPPRTDMVVTLALQILKDSHSRNEQSASETGFGSTTPPLQLGKHYLARFLKRNPSLASEFSNQITKQRAIGQQPAEIAKYFSRLDSVLRKWNIKPHNI